MVRLQHYPERLADLWVVELPTGVSSAFQAVSKALPPGTRAHLHSCSASDVRLPITAQQLDAFAAARPRTRVRLSEIGERLASHW